VESGTRFCDPPIFVRTARPRSHPERNEVRRRRLPKNFPGISPRLRRSPSPSSRISYLVASLIADLFSVRLATRADSGFRAREVGDQRPSQSEANSDAANCPLVPPRARRHPWCTRPLGRTRCVCGKRAEEFPREWDEVGVDRIATCGSRRRRERLADRRRRGDRDADRRRHVIANPGMMQSFSAGDRAPVRKRPTEPCDDPAVTLPHARVHDGPTAAPRPGQERIAEPCCLEDSPGVSSRSRPVFHRRHDLARKIVMTATAIMQTAPARS